MLAKKGHYGAGNVRQARVGPVERAFSSIVRTVLSVWLKDWAQTLGALLEGPCFKAPKPGIVRLMVGIASNLTPARRGPKQRGYEV